MQTHAIGAGFAGTSMDKRRVRVISAPAAEEKSVIQVIVHAFAADPAARWMYPEELEYQTHFQPSCEHSLGRRSSRAPPT